MLYHGPPIKVVLSLVAFWVTSSVDCQDSTSDAAKSKGNQFVDVALLVPPDAAIDYQLQDQLLRNSLDLVNRDLSEKNAGVVLNIFKVVVKHNQLFSDEVLFSKNLTQASFLLEPFSVHPYTCHLADMLSIPHVILTENFDKRCKHSLSFRPENDLLFLGAMARLRRLQPKDIAVICESILSEEAIKLITREQFNKRLPFQLSATLDFSNFKTVVDAITEIHLSPELFRVLLVVRSQYIPVVLAEAARQGLSSTDYKWFVPWVGLSLASETSNIAPFDGLMLPVDLQALQTIENRLPGHKLRGPFLRKERRKIDPMMHDALTIIGKSASIVRNSHAEKATLPSSKTYFDRCPLRRTNRDSDQIYQAAKRVNFDGLTGRVRFTDTGYRDVTELEVASIKQGKIVKDGLWSATCQQISMDPSAKSHLQNGNGNCVKKETDENDSRYPKYRHLTITTLHDPPLMFIDKTKEGNDRFTGFCKDMLDLLSRELNFTYELSIVRKGTFGTKKNGTWDGMIQELIQEAKHKLVQITHTV